MRQCVCVVRAAGWPGLGGSGGRAIWLEESEGVAVDYGV